MGSLISRKPETATITTTTTTTATTIYNPTTTYSTFESTTELTSTVFDTNRSVQNDNLYLIVILPILAIAFILVLIITLTVWISKIRRSKDKYTKSNFQADNDNKTLEYAELDFVKKPDLVQGDIRNNNQETNCDREDVVYKSTDEKALLYVEVTFEKNNDIYINSRQ